MNVDESVHVIRAVSPSSSPFSSHALVPVFDCVAAVAALTYSILVFKFVVCCGIKCSQIVVNNCLIEVILAIQNT